MVSPIKEKYLVYMLALGVILVYKNITPVVAMAALQTLAPALEIHRNPSDLFYYRYAGLCLPMNFIFLLCLKFLALIIIQNFLKSVYIKCIIH